MNITSSSASMDSILSNVPNIPLYNNDNVQKINTPLNSIKELMSLNNLSAREQAVYLFFNVRNFTDKEAVSYKESLSKLFKKTGRKIF
jgi:hypothetical protein